MEYLRVGLASLFSLFALFLLTKLMGNKQMSELTMFDYIIGISIGSIAAEMATELEKPLYPLLAMVIYAVISLFISILGQKSIALRRMFFGKSLILMSNGKIIRKNLKKGRLDLNEFLIQCRQNGYFDLSEIHTAILEPSGKISILPFSKNRPATADDLKIEPKKDSVCYNVIMDGIILEKNLKAAGFDKKWLLSQLKTNGAKNEKEVVFAAITNDGQINLFKNNDAFQKNDIFE